ncbi:unnamed protein product [Urochloa decumbens]|uniref:At1g61320/AtMIF1 LRR domain-containing protein n=1 Tax=Urochloa decumbens TaxID=240449 RepID=A0ABC8XHF2_9POAL
MGLVDLMRHMSMERQPNRRRRRAQATSGLIASRPKKKASPCQRDDDSTGGEIQIPNLPEDIWRHIHSLLPMRDAARAACDHVSTILGMNKRAYENGVARDFSNKVGQILRNHSGIGVKKLKIHMDEYCNTKGSCYLNSWLQIAVTPGIEELAVTLPMQTKYNFTCSLLSNGSGDSIRNLHLAGCALCPTAELACLKSLTKVRLHAVRFTGDALGSFLCNSLALEQLEIRYCDMIVCLRIPWMLQRLRYLEVVGCYRLQVLDSKAPNISSFCYEGDHTVQLSLGETLQMKNIHMIFSGAVHYARVELPSSMPNLKIAAIRSNKEITNTPMLHIKFLHLKKLSIALTAGTFSPAYDYFSLVSFLDACPSLETLILDVSQTEMKHVSIFTESSDLRKVEGQQHHKMKRVNRIHVCKEFD